MLRSTFLRKCVGHESHRPLAEAFWRPFTMGILGHDITKYPFRKSLSALTAEEFTCQVNGMVGDSVLLEDLFIVLLTGFDIPKVSIRSAPESEKPGVFEGDIFVHHTRPFIGWKPTNTEFCLPYTLRLEGDESPDRLSHLCLKVPLKGALLGSDCPENVANCVETPEAMKMLVALRRIRVKPETISYGALMSASKKQDSWSSALGIL